MKKINRFIIVLIVSIISVFSLTRISTNADEITVKYKDNNGVESVDIIQLAKAMNVNVIKKDKDISMVINNKKLAFNEDNSYLYVDDKIVTLCYTKGISDDEEYKLPALTKITKDGDGYLFPVEFIEEYLGISGGDDSIVIRGSMVSNTPVVTTQTNNEENVSSTVNSRGNRTSSVNNSNNPSSHINNSRNPSNISHSNSESNNGNNSSNQNSNKDDVVPSNPSNSEGSNVNNDGADNSGNSGDNGNDDYRHEDDQTGGE